MRSAAKNPERPRDPKAFSNNIFFGVGAVDPPATKVRHYRHLSSKIFSGALNPEASDNKKETYFPPPSRVEDEASTLGSSDVPSFPHEPRYDQDFPFPNGPSRIPERPQSNMESAYLTEEHPRSPLHREDRSMYSSPITSARQARNHQATEGTRSAAQYNKDKMCNRGYNVLTGQTYAEESTSRQNADIVQTMRDEKQARKKFDQERKAPAGIAPSGGGLQSRTNGRPADTGRPW